MKSLLSIRNSKFNDYFLNISFDFSFKNIFILKFINYYLKTMI